MVDKQPHGKEEASQEQGGSQLKESMLRREQEEREKVNSEKQADLKPYMAVAHKLMHQGLGFWVGKVLCLIIGNITPLISMP